MTTPFHAVLSALTLLSIVLPVALTVWALIRACQRWRSWLIYSPPAPRPGTPDARPRGADRGAPDLRTGAREAGLGRNRPQRLPVRGRGGERSTGREHAPHRYAG